MSKRPGPNAGGGAKKAAEKLKAACNEAAANSKAVAIANGEQHVVGSGHKYASAEEARLAKVAAAKAKREAKEMEAKAAKWGGQPG